MTLPIEEAKDYINHVRTELKGSAKIVSSYLKNDGTAMFQIETKIP